MEPIDAPNYLTCAYIHDYTCVCKENWHKRSPNLKHSTSFNQFRILGSSLILIFDCPHGFSHTIHWRHHIFALEAAGLCPTRRGETVGEADVASPDRNRQHPGTSHRKPLGPGLFTMKKQGDFLEIFSTKPSQ